MRSEIIVNIVDGELVKKNGEILLIELKDLDCIGAGAFFK